MELCAVVDGDGLEQTALLANELDDTPIQLRLGVIGELRDEQAPCSTLDERDDAVLGACSTYRVHLPVTDFVPEFHDRGTLGDVSLSREPAPLLGRAIALAVLRPVTKAPPEITGAGLVPPDVLVNRLVADLEQAPPSEPPAHLLRAQIRAEQRLDHAPLLLGELAVLSCATPATVGCLLRSSVPVPTVRMCAVAADFSVDRAAIAFQQTSDLSFRSAGVCFRSVANVYLSSGVIW